MNAVEFRRCSLSCKFASNAVFDDQFDLTCLSQNPVTIADKIINLCFVATRLHKNTNGLPSVCNQ